MKKIMLLGSLAIVLSACGIPKQLSKDCGGDLELGCQQIFGTNNEDDVQEQINNLDSRLSSLEKTVKSNVVSINSLQVSASSTANQIAILQSAQSTDHAAIATLNGQLSSLLSQMLTLQTQANTSTAAIATLNSQDSVIEYLDCAVGSVVDGPGYDEVILRTKSGKLVAYFESGGNRFLSVLVPGSYQTTDQQSCSFTVNNAMKFCDGLGCR